MTTSSRITLITGGNKGIGFETARQLGRLGHTVLIGSRDAKRGQDAASALSKEDRIDARAVTLDVADSASIRSAAASIERDFGRLDVLVNNAGIIVQGADGAPSTTSLATFRTTFDTNFFGLIEVTQTMLPLLRRGTSGRIVNLSSVLGSIAEHSDRNSLIYGMLVTAYNTSKAAVNMYTQQLAHELRETHIKVNAAHPGWVKTDMGGSDAHLEVADGARTSVWLATLPDNGPTGGFYHTQVHMRW